LYEVIPINNELSLKIKENNSDINDYLKLQRIITLKERAISLLYDGITSVEEVYPILLNN